MTESKTRIFSIPSSMLEWNPDDFTCFKAKQRRYVEFMDWLDEASNEMFLTGQAPLETSQPFVLLYLCQYHREYVLNIKKIILEISMGLNPRLVNPRLQMATNAVFMALNQIMKNFPK